MAALAVVTLAAVVAIECVAGTDSKQAFATPEVSANSHTNNTAKAVLRWVPVFEKNFMLCVARTA